MEAFERRGANSLWCSCESADTMRSRHHAHIIKTVSTADSTKYFEASRQNA